MVFSSGMAVVAAVLASALTPNSSGSVLACPPTATTRPDARRRVFRLPRVRVRKALTAGSAQAGPLEGATLVWLETPSNPGLEACDMAYIVEKAHSRNVLVAVDNTTATALGQQPLSSGRTSPYQAIEGAHGPQRPNIWATSRPVDEIGRSA